MICPTCRKPIYTLPSTVPYLYGAYCQCSTLNIRLTISGSTNGFILPGQPPITYSAHAVLEPEVPKAFYDAFSDEELAL